MHQYSYYEKLENGDMHWIIPNKLLAFSSPQKHERDAHGHRCLTPKDYVSFFQSLNIGLVIRLNSKTYDENE